MDFKGPAFLEVIIDRDAGVYPMVGPGQGYDAMITGEFINSRSKPGDDTPDASEQCSLQLQTIRSAVVLQVINHRFVQG